MAKVELDLLCHFCLLKVVAFIGQPGGLVSCYFPKLLYYFFLGIKMLKSSPLIKMCLSVRWLSGMAPEE